ncbi:activated RNA polymerase II transcriptional coactivator p15-like isoform X2 [Acipenser ruthenus]|uniref:activated RNA polymerase II transcriptional coactivator p15-like isoform X2 n=1 Tax=Acipenser ruthenus TaxID=7906 RepID=UPI002741B448|nr:activated RNA polymerase II transcriptional coactivator p15-like isoform X2 [Acipenser ruthenus]XP_058877837.1 activated RNA polymerase II transcriptional coactivator p15-like isoform X2 [Acipenser ruthenus]
MPKSKEIVTSSSGSSSSSDSEENEKVQEEEEEEEERKRKAPAAQPPAVKKRKSGESSSRSNPAPPRQGKEEDMFQIGKLRYVRVSRFRAKVLIDLREFYSDNEGNTKPGRKGIALNLEQWTQLKTLVPEIDAAIFKY